MPELPEVETIRLGLAKKIIGLKIKSIKILNPKSFPGDQKKILNKKILSVSRIAKMLILDLEDNLRLVFHLKMSGQLVLQTTNYHLPTTRLVGGHPTKDMLATLPNKSTRVIFELENYTLFFNDQRKFGWIKIGNLKADFGNLISGLGPEPLEKSFNWQLLKQRLLKRKKTFIKVALLDQQVISGIGNIYACEALFLAQIHPQTPIADLTDQNIKNLTQGIIKALSYGIKYGGSTRTHFVNSEGKKGLFLDYANVYNRAGSPCKICGTKIEKIKLAGRGTFFCPNCQK